MRFKNMRPGAPGIFGNLMAYDPNAFMDAVRRKYQDDEAETARMEALGMQAGMPPAGPANVQDFAKMAMAGQISPEQYNDPSLMANMEQAPAPKEKGKFFGEGGIGRLIAGSIGDALLQQAKMDPIYAPEMIRRAADRREMEKEDKQTQSLLKVWAARNAVPENIELKDGTVVRVAPTGETQVVYQGQPEQTDFMQNVNYVDQLRKTNPELYRQVVGGDFLNKIPGIRTPSASNSGGKKKVQQTKVLPNGTVAYKINGEWYDNPEGI